MRRNATGITLLIKQVLTKTDYEYWGIEVKRNSNNHKLFIEIENCI